MAAFCITRNGRPISSLGGRYHIYRTSEEAQRSVDCTTLRHAREEIDIVLFEEILLRGAEHEQKTEYDPPARVPFEDNYDAILEAADIDDEEEEIDLSSIDDDEEEEVYAPKPTSKAKGKANGKSRRHVRRRVS